MWINIVLNATQSMGIHFGTLKEHPEQTITAHEPDLAYALKNRGASPERFSVLNFKENTS